MLGRAGSIHNRVLSNGCYGLSGSTGCPVGVGRGAVWKSVAVEVRELLGERVQRVSAAEGLPKIRLLLVVVTKRGRLCVICDGYQGWMAGKCTCSGNCKRRVRSIGLIAPSV